MQSDNWQTAKIISTQPAAEDIHSIIVAPDAWVAHRPGQHYELRLPGGDISRKYSVVSAPSRHGQLEFGVQLIPNGALSPALWTLKPGDKLEIRGPLGESFILDTASTEPPVFIGAGSGITPLISMFDAFCELDQPTFPTFIISAKTPARIMHHARLAPRLTPRFTATDGRINITFLAEKLMPHLANPSVNYYVCGPPDFIDSMVDDLLDLGIPEAHIKSERFI